jgi:2-hydroxychromene-2-carboxylate isomerase
MKSGNIEFWFTYGSTYTYLSVMRVERLATEAGLNVIWRPFDRAALDFPPGTPRPVNWGGPFGSPAKLAYMWLDLERRAAEHRLPYVKPLIYPTRWRETAWVGLLGFREGWGAAFTRRVFTMNFVEGKPIGVDNNLADAFRDIGQDPKKVLERSKQPEYEAELVAATEEARARKMFGAPTFWVDGEIFWGDDRLMQAIEWVKRK